MSDNPLISVIMPVYNAERYLNESIESILNQTYENLELIIIDDHSSDGSWAIVKNHSKKDTRIKYYRNKRKLKIPNTRNKGFRLSSKNAKYYAIFDSDDISFPERLQKEVEFLEKNLDYAMVGSYAIIIDENSEIIGLRKYTQTYEAICKKIILENTFAQSSIMIRKDILNEIGFYNEKYTRCQDYDLWFRIANKFKTKNLNLPLIKYRISKRQGKTVFLKEILKFTIDIQKNWITTRKFFNILAFPNLIAEHILLFLPDYIVLSLFKRLKYKKINVQFA